MLRSKFSWYNSCLCSIIYSIAVEGNFFIQMNCILSDMCRDFWSSFSIFLAESMMLMFLTIVIWLINNKSKSFVALMISRLSEPITVLWCNTSNFFLMF